MSASIEFTSDELLQIFVALDALYIGHLERTKRKQVLVKNTEAADGTALAIAAAKAVREKVKQEMDKMHADQVNEQSIDDIKENESNDSE